MNTLFNTEFATDIMPEKPIKTVAITPTTYELTEDDINLHLCIIDTPGFGDRVNRAEEYVSTNA
jgi:septin family protein